MKPIVFSVTGGIMISLIFTLSSFWIFFQYAGSLDSGQNALNTLGAYFGGIATLWAAIIAAYLFNDWREQKKYELEKEYIDKLATSIFNIYQSIFSQSSQILYMYENYTKNKKYSFLYLDRVDFLNISEKDKLSHYLSSLIGEIIPESKFKLNYSDFQETLTFLCLMNEQVYNIYIKQIINSNDYSPYIAFHAEEHQMNQSQLTNYKQIINIVAQNSPLKINNKEKSFTYSELLVEFTSSFDKLNSAIIKYLKP
ncbi:hypothetical protein [Acinetobacter sp. CWB-B33]|uniref:hypothetical protein n=1 Tax=Acinetobacter sp. CWB-B33 TaxID=2815724 RepID=UPI0031FEB7D8